MWGYIVVHMERMYNNKFGMDMVTINAGECLVTTEQIVLHTLLGSCVAVALYDPARGIAGMNHFVLADVHKPRKAAATSWGKYGVRATEHLIELMVAAGGVKAHFVAKVFGGSNMLPDAGAPGQENSPQNLATENYELAFSLLKKENIRVVSHDVGGELGRRVYFFSNDGSVRLVRIQRLLARQYDVQQGHATSRTTGHTGRVSEAGRL